MSTRVSKKSRSLILEIDGPAVTAEAFRRGINAFVDLINEVTRDVSGSSESVKWIITVSRGSAKIHFRADPVNVAPRKLAILTEVIQTGFRTIETESGSPAHFTNTALKKARELVSILAEGNGGPDRIRIWHKKEACSLTPQTLVNVESVLDDSYKDRGTIEGKLSMISERSGYKFTVYDRLLDRHILCTFPPRILPQALDAFGKRVSVFGLIRYRKNGEIENIRVESVVPFPDDDSLPRFSEVFGILGACRATGEV